MSDKQLLPSEDYVNAKNIALYINSELTGEKNIIKTDRADNLFDMSEKFQQERNISSKFCIYGKVESKWGDGDNLRIEFKIKDSSTNVGTGSTNSNYPFWIYDKSSGVSATTWNFMSKSLDISNGSLSKNIYGKKKGHYFFPFELDLNLISNSNKSIFVKIFDTIDGLYCEQEFPFLYFNEDGNVLEYGTETAEILDDGNIIEINNNYPFFYDRHWIRREIEPTGPPFVYFTQSNLTFTEGDPNQPEFINNKIVQFEVALSKPPKGIEKIRLSFVYGLDENFQEYTTIQRQGFPTDIESNFLDIEWNSVTASTVQNVSFKINDDYLVESTERFTLKIIPILGVLPDPEKPQMMSVYIQDNDIPSAVSFDSQSYQFVEPRQDINPLIIPITLNLDRKLLLSWPEQSVELYIDEDETTCLSQFGFRPTVTNNNNTGYTTSKIVLFNITDLSYTTNFYFVSNRTDDLQTQITLRLRGFTSNVVPKNYNQSSDNKFVIYVDKNLDKNYVQINIPFDKTNGKGVLRSAFNKPIDASTYNSLGLNDYITKLITYDESISGTIAPNTQLSSTLPAERHRRLVYEHDFKINILNRGGRIVFDGHTYDNGDTLSINVYSGFTTSVSSGQFIYDGTQFILKLPANDSFHYFEGFNISGTTFLGLNISGGTIWGYQICNYEFEIQNQTYNYIAPYSPNDSNFQLTNLLTSKINYGEYENDNFKLEDTFIVKAGNDLNKEVYYVSTQLKDLNSQIKFETMSTGENAISNIVGNYSYNELTFSPNKILYPGIVIIPKPFLFDISIDNATTEATIFISKNIPILENSFITASTTNQNIYFFPCTNYSIDLTQNVTIETNIFDFGQLFVQCGYYTQTILATLFNNQIGNYQQAITNDSFIAANKYFSGNLPSTIKNGFLYDWSNANVNTKNQAVIEIINEGAIPVKIFNLEIQPNARLWLSEFPIPTSNDNSLITNYVTALDQLNLILPTNSNFIRDSNGLDIYKFTNHKYKISFLNFVLYNESNGQPSNKIVNQTIYLDQNAVININGNAPSYPANTYYLTSLYSPTVWVNHRNFLGYLCDNQMLDIKLLSDSTNFNKSFFVHGFIATASNNSPLLSIKFSDIPVSSRGIECDQNGITWVKSNNLSI